jgi:glycosyltransferase involved in cell wall biosynthesis
MQIDLVVHATHEAGVKFGGIGAVLSGLLGSQAYNQHVARTILIGPIDTDNTAEMERLTAARNKLEIRYYGDRDSSGVEAEVVESLARIEREYGVKLLYGTRAFGPTRHEVILVDGSHAHPDPVNRFKEALYHRFGIQSDRYEGHPEYSQHVQIADAGYLALEAIAGQAGTRRFLIAHEFMGLPLCYSAMLRDRSKYAAIFYGHEVATVRPIVEFHPGHDTMFYTVLAQAQRAGRYLEEIFGDQSGFFKHGLIRPAAAHCDNVFAVGDSVVDEMRFLGPSWEQANIDLVYNGVPSHRIAVLDKRRSRDRLRQYCTNLLGYSPDHVFTHVTRFIPSKGLWRDLRVMEHLDARLAEQGKSAVLYVLSTIIPAGRPAEAIRWMERNYGWPIVHQETTVSIDGQDVPDLVSHEIPFYRAVEQYNRTARASQIVFINQFGWSIDRCGQRMPAAMEFADIRRGSDLEFGQSVYEPFGIAQLEPLCYGALCVLSSVCGCVGFVRRAGGLDTKNVIVADYTADQTAVDTDGQPLPGIQTAMAIDQARRDQIEAAQAASVAAQIAASLPQDEHAAAELLQAGYALSQKMSWQVVAQEYLLPGLQRAGVKHRQSQA